MGNGSLCFCSPQTIWLTVHLWVPSNDFINEWCPPSDDICWIKVYLFRILHDVVRHPQRVPQRSNSSELFSLESPIEQSWVMQETVTLIHRNRTFFMNYEHMLHISANMYLYNRFHFALANGRPPTIYGHIYVYDRETFRK